MENEVIFPDENTTPSFSEKRHGGNVWIIYKSACGCDCRNGKA